MRRTETSPLAARVVGAALARPALVVLLALSGAVLGAVSFRELPQDVFPDLSAPVFNVIVQNPAMGAEDLELGIAIPVEAALAGLPEVRRIRSASQLGVTQITVEFEPDADYYRSRHLVVERLGHVAAQLPAGSEPPVLSSLTGRLNEIIELTIESQSGAVDLMTLRDLAEFEIRNRLLAVPGVAAVERLGGHLRQFQVQIDPDRLAARGVSLSEVLRAAEGANINAAGGFVVQGAMEWAVRGFGRATSVEDLASTVVVRRGSTPVRLGDVADVREAPAVRRGMAHRLHREVVSCRVIKQFGADTVSVAAGVRTALDEIRRALPEGVELRVVYDQADLVHAALGGVARALLLGALFVIAVIVLLLGNLRAALIVTITLPLSIALAGIPLRFLGIGLNTMTLGGLAIAVGLLVDASIIVTENIVHRLTRNSRGETHWQQVLDAAAEVGRPIAFATAIVAAVFLPLFAMHGVEGRMYQPLAAAVTAAMAAALLLALTFTPVASALLVRPRRPGHPEDMRLVRWVKRAYEPLLDACMRRAGAVRAASLVVTVPALWLATQIGSDFMPKLDEGAFMLHTLVPAEASLAQVEDLNHRIEAAFRAVPEVRDVVRRTGRSEHTEDPMPHTMSDVLVVLDPERRRSLDDIESDLRRRAHGVAGVSAFFTTPLLMRIDEGLGGTPADIAVRIFGPDLERLIELGERARDLVAGVNGIADVRVDRLGGLPELRIAVDRLAAARLGLTPGEVLQAVRVGLVGEEISEIWLGQRRYGLVVLLPEERRRDPEAVHSLLVHTDDGSPIPLRQVASIEPSFGPGVIRREAGSRRIAVEATVSGRDLGSTAAEVRQRLAALPLPTGYFVDVGGRVETQQRAARSLLLAVGFAVLAIVVLLHLALGAWAEALVVLVALPDAFVGGILALYLSGETWNVSSLVGLIGLFGIAVQNGLVLITQTRSLIAAGRPFDQALREASIGRVRPKLMTAATAILGLTPLLVLNLPGTEIERPLAIVLVGGLFTSTLFTLLALPTFYALVHQVRSRRRP